MGQENGERKHSDLFIIPQPGAVAKRIRICSHVSMLIKLYFSNFNSKQISFLNQRIGACRYLDSTWLSSAEPLMPHIVFLLAEERHSFQKNHAMYILIKLLLTKAFILLSACLVSIVRLRIGNRGGPLYTSPKD